MNQQTFDLIKFGIQQRIKNEIIRPDVRVNYDAFMNSIAITITGRFLGQRDLMEQEVKYPADWWQAVKERFAPRWFLRRWPVVYTVVHIHVDAVYPELHKKLKMPDEPHKLTIWKEWIE